MGGEEDGFLLGLCVSRTKIPRASGENAEPPKFLSQWADGCYSCRAVGGTPSPERAPARCGRKEWLLKLLLCAERRLHGGEFSEIPLGAEPRHLSDRRELSHVLSPKKEESPERRCPFASAAALADAPWVFPVRRGWRASLPAPSVHLNTPSPPPQPPGREMRLHWRCCPAAGARVGGGAAGWCSVPPAT